MTQNCCLLDGVERVGENDSLSVRTPFIVKQGLGFTQHGALGGVCVGGSSGNGDGVSLVLGL